jgi:CO/xanthine dehydrogenase Mo-binding subunit
MQYKIPTRVDVGKINVELVSSYESQGPFGAKSIGEVVINTPLASIADALSHVAGIRFTELPIMPEQIALKKQFFRKNNN